MKELRKDYFLEEFVLVSPDDDVDRYFSTNNKSSDDSCSICKLDTSDNVIKTEVLSFFELETSHIDAKNVSNIEQKTQKTIYIADKSHKKINKLSISKLFKLLKTTQSVYTDMISTDMKNLQIIINSGQYAGGNSVHNSIEISNFPIPPPVLVAEINSSKQTLLDLGICPMCRIINLETGGPRQIISTVNFFAFCPWASTYSFEFWIYPKSHQLSFSSLNVQELEDLAQILRSTLGGMDNILKNPSYSLVFHNSLNEPDGELHWHIEIYPKLIPKNGFENGFGIYVNTISPEKSAEILGKASRKELASLVGVI